MGHYKSNFTWISGLMFVAVAGLGCKTVEKGSEDAKDTVEDAVSSDVVGRVNDNRGQPVEGVTVKLFDLLDNTDFVEGSDIRSLEAYIDKEAVLASDNDRG